MNELNAEIYINNKREEYKKYFIPKEIGLYNILINFNINIEECSYMFAGCEKIIDINFINFNTKKFTKMKCMFYGCKNLQKIKFSFDTANVTDMSSMFSDCESLNNLPDISKWNTINVTDMNHMFYNCKSLKHLPDISKWNTTNVTDMSSMFSNCKSLIKYLILLNGILQM